MEPNYVHLQFTYPLRYPQIEGEGEGECCARRTGRRRSVSTGCRLQVRVAGCRVRLRGAGAESVARGAG